MNRTLRIVLGILAVLIIAGGSFFGGTLYGKKQAQATFATASQRGAFDDGAFPGSTAQRNGQGGALRGAQSGGMLLGQIQKMDGLILSQPLLNNFLIVAVYTRCLRKGEQQA